MHGVDHNVTAGSYRAAKRANSFELDAVAPYMTAPRDAHHHHPHHAYEYSHRGLPPGATGNGVPPRLGYTHRRPHPLAHPNVHHPYEAAAAAAAVAAHHHHSHSPRPRHPPHHIYHARHFSHPVGSPPAVPVPTTSRDKNFELVCEDVLDAHDEPLRRVSSASAGAPRSASLTPTHAGIHSASRTPTHAHSHSASRTPTHAALTHSASLSPTHVQHLRREMDFSAAAVRRLTGDLAHSSRHPVVHQPPFSPPSSRSPPAVGDGPVERLGDELLVAVTPPEIVHMAQRSPVAAAPSPATATSTAPTAATATGPSKRSVFDTPVGRQQPQPEQTYQDNYLRPKSSSVDTGRRAGLATLDEFSALRINPVERRPVAAAGAGAGGAPQPQPQPLTPSHKTAASAGHQPQQQPQLQPPGALAPKQRKRIVHERARSAGALASVERNLRMPGGVARPPADEGGGSGDVITRDRAESDYSGGRPPPVPASTGTGGVSRTESNGHGGLVPHKRRKRGRRPSAQAQREKRETKRSVYLSPLPAGTTLETIKQLLKPFGGVQTADFIEDGKSCYARFEAYPQADRAVEAGTVGDGIVIMPKKLRVEEVKELQESLAALDAEKKLLQVRLGPLQVGGGEPSAGAGGGSAPSTAKLGRAGALARENGRGHNRHYSNPAGGRFGGASAHHRFGSSGNGGTGIAALSAGKALQLRANNNNNNKGRKGSVQQNGNGGRRPNSRRSSKHGDSFYGSRRSSQTLTSEQLEGNWRGGAALIHRRAISDMSGLNVPERGSTRSAQSAAGGGNTLLAAPSPSAYQPPQLQQQKAAAAASASAAAAAAENLTKSQHTAAAAATSSSSHPPPTTASKSAAANNGGAGAAAAAGGGVSITVTKALHTRNDSHTPPVGHSSPPLGSGGGGRVVVNGPSTQASTGLAAVSVASRPGSRRGSVAEGAAVHVAKGPDGSKGFKWNQNSMHKRE